MNVIGLDSALWTKWWPVLSGAAVAIAALLAGCSANVGSNNPPQAALDAASAPTPGTGKAVKIAMLLPLGGFGPSAMVAKSMKQAGEMALFERDNPNVQLLVKDDGGTAEGARAAADQAIKDGADIILGPLLSKAVSGAAPVARQANVPVLAFSNDPRVAGNGVYLMSFMARPEVGRIVSFAVARGKRRFAALIPADAYGDMVEPAFRAAVARAGGAIVHVERYPIAANGMLDPVKRVAEQIRTAAQAGAPVEALFLPGGQDSLPQLAPLIAYNGIDSKRVQLIGTGAWDFPNIGREQTLAGGWYPSPDPRGWQDFSARFAKTFGHAPPRIATLAFDAVNLGVTLSTRPDGQRFTAAALTDTQGFAGVDGSVTFSPDGISERRLAVIEVQQYGNNVIDAAPHFAISSNGAAAGAQGGRYGGPNTAGSASTSAASTSPVTGSVYVPIPPSQ